MPHPTRPELVTRSRVRDIPLSQGGVLALVTLDNDDAKPNTLGPAGLADLTRTMRGLHDRALHEEIAAVAVTGPPGKFAAGADLRLATRVATFEEAEQLAQAGHTAFGILRELSVPTFAFITGAALGGGLELALHCDYRAVSADVRALGLPETGLGLVPGWGGSYLLPRLVGVRAALDVILTRPATERNLTAADALEMGLVDAMFDSDGFQSAAIGWAESVTRGQLAVARRPLDDDDVWQSACAEARKRLNVLLHGARHAPYRALDLVAAARNTTPAEADAAENAALAALLLDDEMRASVYAFGLVADARRAARSRPGAVAQAPAPGSPEPGAASAMGKHARAGAGPAVGRIGIVGAGLMAAQIAVLAARRLGAGVVMRDLDDERASAGLAAVRAAASKLVASGRIATDEAQRITDLVTTTTDVADLAGCDLVIEAVTEVLDVKRKVFAELEQVVGPHVVLATNTSALSVTAMADGLIHPERVVGLHFFNPVASMPLVEVVRAERTSPETVDVALAVAGGLGKIAVEVGDRPGFVVNRLLVLLLGVVADAAQHGTPVEVADRALDPMALPMGPFALLDLVGPPVALHVLRSLHADLGDRFPVPDGLERIVTERRRVVADAGHGQPRRVNPALQEVFGPAGGGEAGDVLDAVLTALTREIGLMLAEGVVTDVRQVDLAMLLGAGWGRHLGGIAPYLDRTGYSERVLGRRLLPDGVANAPG